MKPSTNTPARITLPRDHPDVVEAERAGFDLQLIEDNLNLTYEERAMAHESALALMCELEHSRESIQSHAAHITA
jgi:hypothetical protein